MGTSAASLDEMSIGVLQEMGEGYNLNQVAGTGPCFWAWMIWFGMFQVHGFVLKFKECHVKSSALCQAFQGDQYHKRVNAEQRATLAGEFQKPMVCFRCFGMFLFIVIAGSVAA